MIAYRTGNVPDVDTVIRLYESSTLGERRPIGDRNRMDHMIRHANLIVTAWDGDRLVGLARSLTDFVYATYLADLAVDLDYQKQGIGRELIRRTQREAPTSRIILLAAPKAVDYYPRIGFRPHTSAWVLDIGGAIQ